VIELLPEGQVRGVTSGRAERPLSILFLTPYFLTPDQPGLLRSWQVARLLAERGHCVTVITTDTHYMTGAGQGQPTRASWRIGTGEIHVRYVSTPRDYRRKKTGRIGYMLGLTIGGLLTGLLTGKQDVVLAATLPPTLPLIGLLLAIVRRAKFVYEVRDMMTDEAVVTGYLRNPLLIWVSYALESMLYRASDAIIAVTPGIKRIIASRGVPESKITVVINGFEEELFLDPPTDVNPRIDHCWGERFVVLYTGAMGITRDLRTIVEAATLLRDDPGVLFAFLGDGEQRPELSALAAQRGLRNCQFLDTVPRKLVPAYCSAADVCVSLFPRKGLWHIILGNKTFDYLGSGRPMIFGGTGDTADLLRAAGAGLVIEPENPRALVEAIATLRADEAQRLEMGRRGKAYVMEKCSRRALTYALVEVIERLGGSEGKGDRLGHE